jgi:enolase
MNIINGGKHADNGLNLQEFMIVPAGFGSFKEALRAGAEVFHSLKKILHAKGLVTAVGDEGGFAPRLNASNPHEEMLKVILQAIVESGYKPGEQIFLALDAAASEFSQVENGECVYFFENSKLSSDQMISVYEGWLNRYPIVSIEDGLSEHDWKGWAKITERLGSRCQLVGDDLFVTNAKVLARGIQSRTANSILIKVNQIGTYTETLETMKMAKKAGYSQITSHRSGETEDAFIADLAVGTDCGQIKTGMQDVDQGPIPYQQHVAVYGDCARKHRIYGPDFDLLQFLVLDHGQYSVKGLVLRLF